MNSLYLLRGKLSAGAGCICAALLFLLAPSARAGLSLEIHFYGDSVNGYSFYLQLHTNSTGPAPAPGFYTTQSPQWGVNGNGSIGYFQLTNGADVQDLTESYGIYYDLGSLMAQVTNGAWTLFFTNTTATATSIYTFTASAPLANSNTLPVTTVTFPQNASTILTSQTNFMWEVPGVLASATPNLAISAQDGSYFNYFSLPNGVTNWAVGLPLDTNITFTVEYDVSNTLVTASAPTNNSQTLAGWQSYSTFAFQGYASFDTLAGRGLPSTGQHTLLSYYTFEDNNLMAKDFSGNGNTLSYAWFGAQPYITNDAEAGHYAAGLPGTAYFTTPNSQSNVFSGSFSVSLWLKTTNFVSQTYGGIYAIYSSVGIVSDSGSSFPEDAIPMAQIGNKLAFYTGGTQPELLQSTASINTGHYVHVVVTRDQQTGQKCMYVNGVLDSSIYTDTNMLAVANTAGPIFGYDDTGTGFVGELDEIQLYSGVLSSNEVAFLYHNPGTNVANTLQLNQPVARYDFENPANAEIDSSGNHHDMNNYTGGSPADVASTNAAVGMYARQFFGVTSYMITPGGPGFNAISNALSGSFSVTAWVNTTNSINLDYANAYFGLPILFLYSGATNSVVPLAITGSKAASSASDENGNDVTLHSTTTVNDGNYHFLAVTRDMASGLISLYVDGNLEATNTSSKSLFQIPFIHVAGGYYVPYAGLLDDLRIYAGVLSADDISTLAANGGPTFNSALGTSGLAWLTSGDANWFLETTNTYNGAAAAAQSGSITGNEQTLLTTTVTGPGLLDFYWSCTANDPNNGFDYEFYIDDPNEFGVQNEGDIADLGGDSDWQSIRDLNSGPVVIPPGTHTIGWIVYANGDTDPTEAAFLDAVRFVSTAASPVQLQNETVLGAKFQFQFTSQVGVTNAVQYSTNLVTGSNWQTYTNIPGDGNLDTVSVPLSIFSRSQQGYIRVLTQ